LKNESFFGRVVAHEEEGGYHSMPSLGRNEIGWNERFRRCLYFFIRDELDRILIHEALVESYKSFKEAGREYPFVERRELKPRAKIIAPEYPEQRRFIVILNEENLPPESKNNIRFFDSNKVTKENLSNLATFDLKDVFHHRMRYFEDKDFRTLLRSLLDSDLAVLIQRDPLVRAQYRFAISHFHVRIDWPVADAADNLARHLRYVSKHLYEKGDRLGEILQQKLYEYYGFHHMVGGRRTAAMVAAQFMQRFDFISTVYVSSGEARTLFRLSEKGVSKYVLVRIPPRDIAELARMANLTEKKFGSEYLIDANAGFGVGIFLVTYTRNEHSLPPADGRLRDLHPDYHWLNVDLQLLVPPPSSAHVRPLPYPIVYAEPVGEPRGRMGAHRRKVLSSDESDEL
jgi:hypothetical protein